MADEQLRLWGDHESDDDPVAPLPVPPEPPPQPKPNATLLDRDLQMIYCKYLLETAERIAISVDPSQPDRRAEYLRMINYELAVDRLSREQRDELQKVVWSQAKS